MKHLILALVVAGGVCTARGDVFLLADGSRLEGIAVESGESMTITTFDGRTLTVPKKICAAACRSRSAMRISRGLKAPAADDAAGRD